MLQMGKITLIFQNHRRRRPEDGASEMDPRLRQRERDILHRGDLRIRSDDVRGQSDGKLSESTQICSESDPSSVASEFGSNRIATEVGPTDTDRIPFPTIKFFVRLRLRAASNIPT